MPGNFPLSRQVTLKFKLIQNLYTTATNYNKSKSISYHVRFFGINRLGCIFCRLCVCSGFGARAGAEVPPASAGLLLPRTVVSSIGGITGRGTVELVG